jgi:hypothetical protein
VLGEERDLVAVGEPRLIFAFIAPESRDRNEPISIFDYLFATAVTLKESDRRSAIGLKVSSHCSALDSSIASYVRIRTEFRLATRNKVHAAQFFCGRAISLIEVPVLSPASAHTCARFLFLYSRRPGRGQAAFARRWV